MFNFDYNHIYIYILQNKLICKLPKSKTWVLPEDRQELRPKYVEATLTKNTMQQFYIKYYMRNIVFRKFKY
jgi:hypothetical protein